MVCVLCILFSGFMFMGLMSETVLFVRDWHLTCDLAHSLRAVDDLAAVMPVEESAAVKKLLGMGK